MLARRVILPTRAIGVLAAASASLLLGACAATGDNPLFMSKQDLVAKAADPANTKSELVKATEYWGKANAEKPADPKAAVNYARNLKAMGNKQQALVVMQEANRHNPMDREINSEYGRLALEHNQFSAAQKLLEAADDPANPDWRTISARGAVLAKQGRHGEAIPFFERALSVSPDNASVLNNLAMANAMEGRPGKAEDLLRRATSIQPADPRLQQNLALVLGLQGKHSEAKEVSEQALPPDLAAHNGDVMKQMVGAEPVAAAIPAPAVASADPQPVAEPAAKIEKASLRTTASVSKGKKGKQADAFAGAVDAGELVRRLADADAAKRESGQGN